MKKKNIIFILVGILSFPLFAQTKAEREKIVASYNMEEIENLKLLLNKRYLEKEERISRYLLENINAKRKVTVGNKNYVIYDIEDGKPVYRTTTNMNSAKGTNTDKLYPGGGLGLNLEGQNMSIGVWDEESALGTHDEFKDDQAIPQSRVVYPEFGDAGFLGTTSSHATHVAGTLIAKGANPEAKGMAPKAILRSFDWNSDDAEALTEAGNGLLLSNHSYGIPLSSVSAANIGAYVSDARVWDQVAYAAPYYLPVKSAGNGGTETYSGGLASGYDKLTGNKTAKNALIIANADPFLTASGFILRINSGSSQGPTDDFRIKPDIAGDGSSVKSSTNADNSDYSTFSGTSMAAPNVSGTLLLLQQYYNQLNSNYMRAATLKGLVCHTAVDDTRKGPDPIYGWGFLDAEKSANIISNDNSNTAVIKELSLNDGATYTYEFSAATGSELRATICWTDPAGTSSSSSGNVLTPRLVNDLDLRLEDNVSTVFTPWKLDKTNVAAAAIKGDNDVDNIERIDIASPVAGNYTLTVTHKGTLTNGSQPFSLILTGANLTLSTQENSLVNVKIWPNPVNDKLNINFKTTNNKTEISFHNILGKKIYHESLNTNSSIMEYSLNIESFPKGFYFLNIINGTSNYNQKIIIK